jgi:hypothetical protein
MLLLGLLLLPGLTVRAIQVNTLIAFSFPPSFLY